METWGVAADEVGNSDGARDGLSYPLSISGVSVSQPGIYMTPQSVWAKFDKGSGSLYLCYSVWMCRNLHITIDTAGDLIAFGSVYDGTIIDGVTIRIPPLHDQYFIAKFSPSETLLYVISEGK
jgi:hypothetical protein